jgi:phosphate transport system substrate-binding protein
MSSKPVSGLLLPLFLLLLLSGCNVTPQQSGGGVETVQWDTLSPAGAGMLPPVDPLEVRGTIIIAGSSTVYPLTEAMVVRFRDEGSNGQVTIDSIGTGGGFERFCRTAEIDIANASRPIKSGEAEACRANGREPIEFRVGTDALAVVVSRANDFLTDLSIEQLAQIYSGQVTRWNEVDPSFPNEPIRLFSPGTDSGTYDYFVEEVLDHDATGLLSVENMQFSEDDNVLVQGIEGSPYALGYFGYAYYLENRSRLRVLSIDGIEPTAESTESGEYPLSRPLYIYSAASVMQERPQVAAFVNFYLTYVNEEVGDIGYFAATPQTLDNSRRLWLDAMRRQ